MLAPFQPGRDGFLNQHCAKRIQQLSAKPFRFSFYSGYHFPMKHFIPLLSAFIFTAWFSEHPVHAQSLPSDFARVAPGSTKAINALWGENPLVVLFRTTTDVVVADLKGPAEITMIHFAYPGRRDPVTHSLNRDVRLRIFWDGETTPERGLSPGGLFLRSKRGARLRQHRACERSPGFQRLFPHALPQICPGRVAI
jgi:hypothetical protein